MTTLRQPQNVLVTGGCGFIGSAFIRFLFRQAGFSGKIVNLDLLTYAANPDNVAGAVDPARYTFVQGDIGDSELVSRLCREHAVDTLVHFAAESHVDRSIVGPGAFMQANILGTYQLLEVVRTLSHIHFHHVSTDEVYGSLGPTGLFSETTPYDPSSPYSASKAASDHLVRAYARTYGISTTLSNCSNNFGDEFKLMQQLTTVRHIQSMQTFCYLSKRLLTSCGPNLYVFALMGWLRNEQVDCAQRYGRGGKWQSPLCRIQSLLITVVRHKRQCAATLI